MTNLLLPVFTVLFGLRVAVPMLTLTPALHDLVKAGKVRDLGAPSMHAYEFSKVLHTQRHNGLARFSSMQNHYNLLARGRYGRCCGSAPTRGSAQQNWVPPPRKFPTLSTNISHGVRAQDASESRRR
jgi:aryl-alcohol dehydrogenase-like predicted oxidoreductase